MEDIESIDNKSEIPNLYCMSCKSHTDNVNPVIYYTEENGRRVCRVKAECASKDKHKTENGFKTRKFKDSNKSEHVDSTIGTTSEENSDGVVEKKPRKQRKKKIEVQHADEDLTKEFEMYKLFKSLMSKQ